VGARPTEKRYCEVARLESIQYVPHRAEVLATGKVLWQPVAGSVIRLPQVVWADFSPWQYANLWARDRAMSSDVDIQTVQSDMAALHAYAQWLERTGTDWRSFPRREEDRCLKKYRKALIEARDASEISPSTTTTRMASVIKFYRWVHEKGLLAPDWPMWQERTVPIRYFDAVGFERAMTVRSTSLSIPNRRRIGDRLEDGLLPVAAGDRDAILDFAADFASEELFLMLTTAFYTGIRSIVGELTESV
jgi:hypothetical protein